MSYQILLNNLYGFHALVQLTEEHLSRVALNNGNIMRKDFLEVIFLVRFKIPPAQINLLILKPVVTLPIEISILKFNRHLKLIRLKIKLFFSYALPLILLLPQSSLCQWMASLVMLLFKSNNSKLLLTTSSLSYISNQSLGMWFLSLNIPKICSLISIINYYFCHIPCLRVF